jgi:hypothetical protein
MSHPVRAARIAALLTIAALAVPGVAAAKPGHAPCGKNKPRHTNCGKHKGKKPKPKPVPKQPGTPVTVNLLDGSTATVDIPAVQLPGGYVLPGVPTSRTIALSGQLKGLIPGGYQIAKDNNVNLASAAIGLGAVDLLSDAACGGATVLHLNPSSYVSLGSAQPSVATLHTDGTITATVDVALNLAFDSRQGTGCGDPLTTMGNSTTTYPLTVAGKIEPGKGLASLELNTAAPVPVSVSVCLTPGAANAPCGTPPVAYPVKIGVHVITGIKIG